MSISIGGIDIPNTLINCEWRLGVLERIVERLGRTAPPGAITQADIEAIRNEVFAQMQAKYPQAGLSRATQNT